MALISCPECNKEVSDSASSCPFCGYSVATYVKKEKLKNKINVFCEKIHNSKHIIRQACKISFVLSFLVCLIFSICLYTHYDDEQTKAEQIHDNIEQAILEDDPNVDIEYFKGMSKQTARAEEMEKLKNRTFPIAFGVLVVIETVIFVIFKKTNTENIYLNSIESNIPANTIECDSLAAWENFKNSQGGKVGRCSLCGKKHQPLVFFEFEDQFGKGQGNLCYDCFCKKYK